jgi:hypothetical protein
VLVVAMVLAACWGVLQLAVLGSATRSVRAGTLLLAVGAGVYGCGVFAVAVQYTWTRLYAGATGNPVYQVVETASYTADPFIEEVAKVLPLLVLAWSARARLQRGLTDHLLHGAATGAGFGLLEALMRFGSRAGTAVGMPGGWVLPISLSPPMVPSPGSTMTSWLPAPAGGDGLLSFGAGTGTNLHLAWSALAGLGVGLLVRGRGPVRLLGPLLVALVGADHAAYNYDLRHPGDSGLAGHLAAPFVTAQPLLCLWPLLALAAAIVIDVRWLRRARSLAPDLRLRRERDTTGPGVGVVGYAMLGLPWTPLVIARFVALRRAALYAVTPTAQAGPAAGADPRPAQAVESLAEAVDVRDQLDAADSPTAWHGIVALRPQVRSRAGGSTWRLHPWWPVLPWIVLLVPTFLYYGAGSTPAAAGVQHTLQQRWPFLLVILLPAAAGLVLLIWQVVRLVRRLPAALHAPHGEAAAQIQLRLGVALGSAGLAAVALGAWLRGTAPQSALLSGYHVLDALSSLLLIAGVALVIAAFVFFPPSIGLVATTTGLLVPTIAISGAFATTAGLGAMSVLLSQAAAGAGASSSAGDGSDGGEAGGGQGPPRLSPAQRRSLGNLAGDADETVSEMIRLRGGGAGQVAQLETGYGQLTLREIARRAVNGDPQAIKALKMIKQAGTQGKGGKYQCHRSMPRNWVPWSGSELSTRCRPTPDLLTVATTNTSSVSSAGRSSSPPSRRTTPSPSRWGTSR